MIKVPVCFDIFICARLSAERVLLARNLLYAFCGLGERAPAVRVV